MSGNLTSGHPANERLTNDQPTSDHPTNGIGQLPLDHLVFAVPRIDEYVEEFADAMGVRPVFGGRHEGRGTKNYLLGFETGNENPAYLELLGLDPEQSGGVLVGSVFGVGELGSDFRPHIRTWAIHPSDFEGTVSRVRAAGVDVGSVESMTRRTPEGEQLEWQLTVSPSLPERGLLPFLIDWGTSPHPSRAEGLPSVELLRLRLEHSHPDLLRPALQAYGLEGLIDVHYALVPSLVATLKTPRGEFELR